MKKNLIVMPSLLFALCGSVLGQDLFNISWNVGFPTADTKDYLVDEDISLGGMGLDYRHFVQDNLSIGWYFAWDFFNGATEGTTTFVNGDVTGVQRNILNYFPIMVNSHYYFGESEGVRTYVGAGLGTVHTLQRTSIGTFYINNNNWHFGIYPEVGILVPVFGDKNISLGAKYHVAFETDDSINYSYLSLNLGFSTRFFE